MDVRYLTSEVAELSDGGDRKSGYHSVIKIANFCIFRGMWILILVTLIVTVLLLIDKLKTVNTESLF